MRRAIIIIGAVVITIVLGAPSYAQPEQSAEASCVFEGVPEPVRQALTGDMTERPRGTAAMRQYSDVLGEALLRCTQSFDWSPEQVEAAAMAFQYKIRLDASLSGLTANGLDAANAGRMFEALPSSMHDAIFGERDMTREEMDLLQARFEGLVERLDGPDGDALSEYIEARAGYGYYTRDLLAD